MWIHIRSMDGKKAVRLDGLSKLTRIEDLREKLVDEFDAPTDRQRLFYRGKQLEDGHSLFDYDVGLNEIIQLMVRQPAPAALATISNGVREKEADGAASSGDESCSSNKENVQPKVEEMEVEDKYEELDSTYRMGDIIDAKDVEMGAWFEAALVKITSKPRTDSSTTTSSKPTDLNDNVTKDDNGNDTTKDKEISEENTPSEKQSEEKTDSQDSRTESCKNDGDSQSSETESTKTENTKTDTDVTTKSGVSALAEGVLEDDGFLYHVAYEGYEEDDPVALPVKNVRPRARHKVKLDTVDVGTRVMVNYNYDEPETRGYWYDAIVTGKRNTRTIKELHCTIFIGKDLVPMENCKVLYVDEIFEIEQPGTQLNKEDHGSASQTPTKRDVKPECDHCMDNTRRKCKHCACCVCGEKRDPDKQLACDECDEFYHLWCLSPPLDDIPEDEEWYCPKCKVDKSEVVRAGEKLKDSKKKSRMASASSTSTRDWGRGMACVGRTKKCNIVPSNHYGPVPGIEVGMLWKFRVQASEAGVHRPHVAGIHGREDDGAFSIVLSGGYEDDKDNGDDFTYTGSGGRDLSGNKRTAEQSCDQLLTRMNMALAKNCNAPIDKKKGAEAKDWKGGKAVRVVRNFKGSAHSKYAPEEGNRYDGIYKVVKYWPAKGKSGFIVWRYLLRRDDPSPAPWTKEGKKRIAKLGLEIQYPEGWLESQQAKEQEKKEGKGKTPKGKGKRKRVESDSEEESESPVKKKANKAAYEVDENIAKLIKEDDPNRKCWDEALSCTSEGAQKFLAKVEELFVCICCQDLAFKPITTTCAHNVCKTCLQRSFKAEVYSCPACRTDLGQGMKMDVNKALCKALNGLFPGYENGR